MDLHNTFFALENYKTILSIGFLKIKDEISF